MILTHLIKFFFEVVYNNGKAKISDENLFNVTLNDGLNSFVSLSDILILNLKQSDACNFLCVGSDNQLFNVRVSDD